MYFNSSSFTMMSATPEVDSDDDGARREIDESARLIHEFTDLAEEELQYMVKWNSVALRFRCLGNVTKARRCVRRSLERTGARCVRRISSRIISEPFWRCTNSAQSTARASCTPSGWPQMSPGESARGLEETFDSLVLDLLSLAKFAREMLAKFHRRFD